MITIPLQIRPSDCDSLDHVNNAAYVAYVQYALAEFLARQGFAADWTAQSPYFWAMQDLAIEFRLASSFGDEIVARIWLAEPDGIEPVFGCEIVHSGSDRLEVAIRSRSRWRRRDSRSGQAVTLPDAFLEAQGEQKGDLPRPFKTPADSEDVRSYRWQHVVERTEVGQGGRIHPHILYEYIEESILSASAAAGWPIERYLAEDFIVFQMRHDTRFWSEPALGEPVEITNKLINVRRLRGTWQNEIRSLAGGRLLASNYSTGVFLSLNGRPKSPPPGLIEALQSPIE